jgi:hypothetical protein
MPLSALPTPGHSSESFVAMSQLSATSCEFDAAIRFSQETNSNRHFIPGVPAERNTNSRQPPFSSLAALPAEEEYIGVDFAAGIADAIADGGISRLLAPLACPAPPEGARLSATTTTTAGAGAAAGREREDGSLATLIISYSLLYIDY